MSFLADTNIFLEILPNQPGRAKCEQFLRASAGGLAIATQDRHFEIVKNEVEVRFI